MDADLSVMGQASTLKRELHDRLLAPMQAKESRAESWLRPNSPTASPVTSAPLYSLILFGPPGDSSDRACLTMNNLVCLVTGTAKTTITTSIANYLGWSFVTIDTSCFLADGMENVGPRMSYIFDRLKASCRLPD